ncbi:alpha-D-glucose-1-phosphatase [Hartmannibacter diazotrophicus]|uniref:Alpha-D-glucose-1-phosphatase n=1 Tax=Hartmannibacter diazotrophicus TaxID=1482074 RepID=A0A2C9D5B2_9HYPH|nr:HAD family phosphatase [Hartmannibacter diazotrophicus]SON54695.1 alpha-D-glucose-1-phosphatase [Hartmannibacter diazotrophicus]
MSEKIRHVVFDIGRVLVHYEAEVPYRHLIPDEKTRRWFLDNVCTDAWNYEQDRGRSWADAEAVLIAEHPDWENLIRAFRRHWHEMVPYAYDGTVSIMDELLEAGYDVTLLTNFSADTFPEVQELYPFLKKPRGATVSGLVGVMKPDPAIYKAHVEAFDLDPAATVFIDDKLENVDAAKAAGWQGIHFSDAEALRQEIGAMGLLAT